jgi:Primase X
MSNIGEGELQNQGSQEYIPNHLSTNDLVVAEGLDFILSHFEEPMWPRTIFTYTLGRQLVVYSKQEALARFKQTNLLDCRINAYPDYTGFENINRQAPDFILIDIDRSRFKTDRQFLLAVNKTCKIIKELLGDKPTILWTGNGVHIYQPVEGFVLELERLFSEFNQPSQSFLKFAAQHLSNNKSDLQNNPAFRSCLVRIPGTYNFKCVQKNNGIVNSVAEVKIMQKWNGYRHKINSLLYPFYIWIAGEKIKEINQLQKMNKKGKKYNNSSSNSSINWIEILLRTPISDHRKFVSYWILSRYLVNVKHMDPNEASAVLKDWSLKCNELEPLLPSTRDFDKRIRDGIKEAVKSGKAPIGKNLLKVMNKELYLKQVQEFVNQAH